MSWGSLVSRMTRVQAGWTGYNFWQPHGGIFSSLLLHSDRL